MSKRFSTLGELCYLFEFLKLIGIFPFLIKYESRGSSKRIKRILFHRSGIYYWLNQFSVGLYLTCFIFMICSLRIHLLQGETTEAVLNGAWVCTTAAVLATLLSFHLRKVKLCEFLNRWIQVEDAITDGNGKP